MEAEIKEKIKRIIEALLFVTPHPLAIKEIRDVVSDVDVLPEKQILPLLEELACEYDAQGRSFLLEETSEGFQIRTRPQYAPWLCKLYKDRRSEKLSHAVLETLAIIAYRQPITKSEIEGVRGVDATGPLKKCLDLNLVAVVGKKEILGRPFVYGTTQKFLKQFGLKTIEELPQIKELREMGTRQEELDLEPGEMNASEDNELANAIADPQNNELKISHTEEGVEAVEENKKGEL